MSQIDVADELEQLDPLLSAFEELVDGPAFLSRAKTSNWSVGQHVGHIALATAYSLRNVLEILDGGGRHTQEGGEPNAIGRAVLEGGRIPRGVADAPEPVTVGDDPDVHEVRERLSVGRERWQAIRDRADELAPGELRVVHPMLGPLDATEWLRFAQVHGAHHLEIVQEIVGSTEPPPA